MKQRTGGRTVKSDARFFKAKLGAREAQFKLPNPARCMDLLGAFPDKGQGAAYAARFQRLQSAVVGALWFDTKYDLETPRSMPGDDLLMYGDAVLDELCDEGLTMGDISDAFEECWGRLIAAVRGPDAEDVKDAGDFTEPVEPAP